MAVSNLMFGLPLVPTPLPTGTPPGVTCNLVISQTLFPVSVFLALPQLGIVSFPIPADPTLVGLGWDVQAATAHTDGTVTTSNAMFVGI